MVLSKLPVLITPPPQKKNPLVIDRSGLGLVFYALRNQLNDSRFYFSFLLLRLYPRYMHSQGIATQLWSDGRVAWGVCVFSGYCGGLVIKFCFCCLKSYILGFREKRTEHISFLACETNFLRQDHCDNKKLTRAPVTRST